MIDRSKKMSRARAAARSTLVGYLLAVVVANSAAQYASAKRDVSERDLRAASAAPSVRMSNVTECKGCKEERGKGGKPPRPIERLPIGVTQHKLFNKKGVPVALCAYCDGDALALAIATHDKF